MPAARYNWSYGPRYPLEHCYGRPINKLLDPRVELVKHMGWERNRITGFPGYTLWTSPEPDNYTHAIADDHCHYIPDVRDQIWFRWSLYDLWCSMFITTDDIFNQYIQLHDVMASTAIVHKPRRQRMPTIQYELHRRWRARSADDHALDQQLYYQGFFDSLVIKGASPDDIHNYIGRIPDDITELVAPEINTDVEI